MASQIPGYEYDIFISYRQKDNKGDKWVSKFVDSLKTELESTFKEDVSVYFDENPHDRLQETHNVDKSLEGKLKCLIFIPILSQTYCDPNSYAWQYEFLAFLKMSGSDLFGKDVKLRSGNVASRILPIRIHDLEPEDVNLFEKETCSVLRALDFVFKTSTGVIRPLLPNEDHPNDNLNKIYYRDQISKVAYSIKEIILGMKKEPETSVKEKEKAKVVLTEESNVPPEIPAKPGKHKFIPFAAIISVLVIIAIFAYPKIFKKDTLENLRSSGERISVAVMPFQNMTNDTSLNYMQKVIQENLIAYLSIYSDELQVRQTETINSLMQGRGIDNYASFSSSIAKTISQKLETDVFIYGSIQLAGLKLRLNAKLIDTESEEVLKSFEMDISYRLENIFNLTDSLRKKIADFLIISKLEKKVAPEIQNLAITSSPEAYRNFISGNSAFMKFDYQTAVKYYEQAVNTDSNFYFAVISLSLAYYNQQLYDQAKKWCLKVYNKRDQIPLKHKLMTNWIYAYCFETPKENIKYLNQLLEFDDQVPRFYYNLGRNYMLLDQYENGIPELIKALELYKKWDTKPMWAANYTQLGFAFHMTGQFEKEKKIYLEAEKDFPNDPELIIRQAVLALTEENMIDANNYIEKYVSICKGRSNTEAYITDQLARIYTEAEIYEKAEEYYRKNTYLEPENANWLDNLSYFLIDKDRNTNEGLILIEKALLKDPGNFQYLHTKGWGLYKLGKFNEALDILQKSWDLRIEKAVYNHKAFLHLEAAKKAVAGLK